MKKADGVWCYAPGPPNPEDFDFAYRIGEHDFFTGSYKSDWTGTFNGSSIDNGLVIWRDFPDSYTEGPAMFVDLIVFDSVEVRGKTGGLELYLYGERETDFWEGPWFIVGASGELEGLEGRGKWWQWQGDSESGAVAFLAVDLDTPLMVLNDSVADGQAEAGALLFGRKKRFKNFIQVFVGYPAPCVLDFHDDKFIPGRHPAAYRNDAFIIDGMHGIEQQIDKYLFKLMCVQHGLCHCGGELRIQLDVPQSKLVFQDTQRLLDDGVDIRHGFTGFTIPGELQQFLDDDLAALGLLHDNFQAFFDGPGSGFFYQVGTVQQNARQRIVDFMGDARSHAPQSGQLFGLQGQLIILGLLRFDEPGLADGAGAQLGKRNGKIDFLVRKIPPGGKKNS